MRGCLFVLVVAAAVLTAGAWLLAPAVAEAIVGGSLSATGFSATSRTLTVRSDPPLALLLGRADTVQLDAVGVAWHSVSATRLGLELDGVDLFGRTASAVHGRFDGVPVDGGSGAGPADAALATITFDGPSDAAATTIDIDAGSVSSLVGGALMTSFSVRPTTVELAAPNRLRVTVPGATIEGTLTLTGARSIGLSTRLGTVPLVSIEDSLPLTLSAVSVHGADLRIVGVLDVSALLGGDGQS